MEGEEGGAAGCSGDGRRCGSPRTVAWDVVLASLVLVFVVMAIIGKCEIVAKDNTKSNEQREETTREQDEDYYVRAWTAVVVVVVGERK